MNVIRAIRLISFVTAFAICAANAPPARSEFSEIAVKAAFIYNFAKFIRWPADRFKPGESAFTICMWGRGPMGSAIGRLAGKKIQNSTIQVRQLANTETVVGCHIVYVSQSASENVAEALRRVSRINVLTVGNVATFAERGGIINLLRTGNRVRFEINVEAARLSGLKFSSKLLRLAKIIQTIR